MEVRIFIFSLIAIGPFLSIAQKPTFGGATKGQPVAAPGTAIVAVSFLTSEASLLCQGEQGKEIMIDEVFSQGSSLVNSVGVGDTLLVSTQFYGEYLSCEECKVILKEGLCNDPKETFYTLHPLKE